MNTTHVGPLNLNGRKKKTTLLCIFSELEGLWEWISSTHHRATPRFPYWRLRPPTGSSGRPLHLLREPFPVPGGEPQVEEPFRLGAKQLHHQHLWEQNGETGTSGWFVLLSKSKRGFDSVSALCSQAHDRGLHPKGTINCAGYKALTSVEEYMELIGASLPGRK